MVTAIKTVLVPLDPGGRNQAALDAAREAAARFDARLDVLYIRPDPSETLSYVTIDLPDATQRTLVDTAEAGAAEMAKRARKTFDEYCRQYKLNAVDANAPPAASSVAWWEETGRRSYVISYRGRLADLIVIDRPAEERARSAPIEAALLETGRPVLMVPAKPKAAPGDRIAIAWNGSAEAASAIAAAMPYLDQAGEVTILARKDWNKPSPSPKEVASYLAWHGVEAKVRGFTTGDRSVGETILAEAKSAGADMIVMGAYGHGRMQEMILGGVTRHMLEAADLDVYVLMSH